MTTRPTATTQLPSALERSQFQHCRRAATLASGSRAVRQQIAKNHSRGRRLLQCPVPWPFPLHSKTDVPSCCGTWRCYPSVTVPARAGLVELRAPVTSTGESDGFAPSAVIPDYFTSRAATTVLLRIEPDSDGSVEAAVCSCLCCGRKCGGVARRTISTPLSISWQKASNPTNRRSRGTSIF